MHIELGTNQASILVDLKPQHSKQQDSKHLSKIISARRYSFTIIPHLIWKIVLLFGVQCSDSTEKKLILDFATAQAVSHQPNNVEAQV
jgi:hypothetical protein